MEPVPPPSSMTGSPESAGTSRAIAAASSRPLGAMAPILSGSFRQRRRNRIGSLLMNDLEGLMGRLPPQHKERFACTQAIWQLSVVVTREKHLVHGVENSEQLTEFLHERRLIETPAFAGGKIAVDVGERAAA